MKRLKYGTSCILAPIGPFLSTTDGVTIKGALTISSEKISFHMQATTNTVPITVLDNSTASTTGDNALNYISGADDGMMQLALTSANTSYLGHGRISVLDVSNHCPVWEDVEILPAQIYDSLVLGTDLIDSNASQIGGQTASAAATIAFPATIASPSNITSGTITTVSGNVVGNVSGSVGSLATQAKTDVKDQVVAAVSTDAYAELAAVPAANAGLAAKITWLAMHARNKKDQTSSNVTLYADDGSTPVATATVSDNGTTFTRAEFA